MPEPAPAPETPQFDTAEYHGVTTPDWCRTCKQPIVSTYYRVKGEMACAGCAEIAKGQVPVHTAGAFARAVVFGCFAAVAGLVLYAAVGITTGLEIGFVALAVGYIIGKAMMKGSNGMGGRRYQIVALILTYAAVSLAAVPIAISAYMKQNTAQTQVAQQQASNPTSQAPTGSSTSESAQPPVGQANAGTTAAEEQQMSLGKAFGSLFLIGIASPILGLQDPVNGAIGLIILFVGLQIAWKTTAGSVFEVEGPYNV